MNKVLIGISLMSCLLFFSCKTIQPYEQMYVNDKDMGVATDKLEKFEQSFQNYREGAAGADGGKSGGGCGCY